MILVSNEVVKRKNGLQDTNTLQHIQHNSGLQMEAIFSLAVSKYAFLRKSQTWYSRYLRSTIREIYTKNWRGHLQ
jgi:hypothetical protein